MQVSGRYEITEKPLGQGGMGVVYKAYDNVTQRFVALKTLWADPSPSTLEMFEREWTLQSRLSHPNIVDILDRGEWEFNGQRRPYFVMPLLDGATLDEIIKKGGERLSVERVIDIMSQACRGLEAAHAQNFVHRDIKPSNIFVMADDSVKVIDFGMAYQDDGRPVGGMKGTPLYMAPEQLDMKPATPMSDIFSLGAVCYEALTGRNPFARKTEGELAEAIRTYVPPPASDLNPAVNQAISRTVHKAMAKQPWHRFASAREFGDTLEKALRNEPIERFDRSKIQPRIDRIQRAYSEGDEKFALEILRELEAEGHIDPEMSSLRIQIEQSLRQKNIGQLLESARVRMDEQEYPLALQKVADALLVDPDSSEARALKTKIERLRSSQQVDNWFRLVREQVKSHQFGPARQGLEQILLLDSSNTAARRMLSEIDQTEQEITRLREEKQRIHDEAMSSYRNGEINTALSQLEKFLELAKTGNPTATPQLDAECQELYDKLRGERDHARNAYAEGRKSLTDGNTAQALQICEDYLRKHPDDAMFQALKLEAEEAQREQLAAAITEVTRRADNEPDLDKKYSIVKEAADRFPNEAHFVSALKLVRDRRELVNGIVSRARQYEDRGQFNDAASQWDILRNVYPAYPGLDSEIERAAKRKEEQAQSDAKARWLDRVDNHFNAGEYAKAHAAIGEALTMFPDDRDLLAKRSLAEQGVTRAGEANELLKKGQELCAERKFAEGLAVLRRAERLDPRNGTARAALLGALVSEAREVISSDWRGAEPLVKEALELEPSDPVARSLASILEDYRRQDAISNVLIETRNLQADGRLDDALKRIEDGVKQFPNEARLSQLYNSIRQQAGDAFHPAPSPAPPLQESPSTLSVPLPVNLPSQPEGATAVFNDPLPVSEPVEAAAETTKPKMFRPIETGVSAPAAKVDKPRPGTVSPVWTPRPKAPSRPNADRSVWQITLFTAAGLIAAAALYTFAFGHKSPSAIVKPSNPVEPAPVAVVLESDVPGTRFTENGHAISATDTLSVGEHQITAGRDGYVPETKIVSITADTKAPVIVRFLMQPALAQIHLSSGITAGKATLDETENIDLQAGVMRKDDLTVGPHTLKVFDHNRLVFSIAFEAKSGEMPRVVSPFGPQAAQGAVVTSLNGTARIYATPGVKAATGTDAPRIVPPQGIEVVGTPDNPGRFALELTSGHKGEQLADSSSFPILNILLAGAAQPALLGITANVPGCGIWLDGKKLPQAMKGTAQTIAVAPGVHAIRLTHDGLQDAEQQVEIKATDLGTLKKLVMVLAPIPVTSAPRRALFTIAGAPAEAAVFQNGVRIGTVAANGTFSKEIDPGQYTWEWRKPGFANRQESRAVKAGESIKFDGAMIALQGTLLVKVAPAGAHVSARRESDGAEITLLSGSPLPLPPGTYQLRAEAADHTPKQQLVTIEAGKTIDLDWELETAKVEAWPERFFENGATWKSGPEGGWMLHSGGGYSALRSSTGTFQFDFLKQKGTFRSKKINLLADCDNHKNCTVISIDSHNVSWKTTEDGETVDEDKKAHHMDNNPVYEFIFELTQESIIIKNKSGDVLVKAPRKSNPGKLNIQDDTPLKIN